MILQYKCNVILYTDIVPLQRCSIAALHLLDWDPAVAAVRFRFTDCSGCTGLITSRLGYTQNVSKLNKISQSVSSNDFAEPRFDKITTWYLG